MTVTARTSRWVRISATARAHLQGAVDALAERRRRHGRRRLARVRDRAGRRTPTGRVSSTPSSRSTPTLDPHALLALGAANSSTPRDRVRAERWGPRTLDVDVLLYDDVAARRRPTSPFRTRGCGSAASCSRRCATSRPSWSTRRRPGKASDRTAVTLRIPWRNRQRTVALIGPGRAGTTIALGLLELGWTVVGGRRPRARRRRRPRRRPRASRRRPALVSEVGPRRRARRRRHARPRHRAGRCIDRRTRRSNRARSSCTSPVRAGSTCSTPLLAAAHRRPGRRAAPVAVVPVDDGRPRAPRGRVGRGRGRSRGRRHRPRARAAAVRARRRRPRPLPHGRGRRLEPPRRAARSGRAARRRVARAVRGVRPARARVGAERVRARSRPRRSPDRSRAATSPPSSSTCATSIPPSATRTAPSPARPPGSPAGATPASTACSTTSASNRPADTPE